MNKMETLLFIFNEKDILLKRCADGTYTIPDMETAPIKDNRQNDNMQNDDRQNDDRQVEMMTVTAMDGTEVKACHVEKEWVEDVIKGAAVDAAIDTGYEWCGLRQSYYKLTDYLYRTAGKCKEMVYWNRNNRYCGVCGGKLEMHTAISKRCPKCGKEIWPLLSTAVIVLVHRGDEVLLVHARNFRGKFFGLVAGFVETGETLEEAVRREVMEETGICIDNLRYFGSQPWPYPCGLMVGFNADYVSGEIKLQEEELAAAAWFDRYHLPEIPEKLSIARQIIDAWLSSTPAASF